MDPPPFENDLFMLDNNDLPPYSREPELVNLVDSTENELVPTFSELELEYFNVLHDLDSSTPNSINVIEKNDPLQSIHSHNSVPVNYPQEIEGLPLESTYSEEISKSQVPQNASAAMIPSGRQSPSLLLTLKDIFGQRECKIILTRCDENIERKKLQTAKRSKRLLPKRNITTSPIKNEGCSNDQEPEMPPHSPHQTKNLAVSSPLPLPKKKETLVYSGNINRVRGRPKMNDTILSKADLDNIDSADQLITQLSTGEYQCTCCGRRFPNKTNLIIHLRIHSGERPYTCNQCNETYKQLSHVQQHAKNVHQIEITRQEVYFNPGRLERLVSGTLRKRVLRRSNTTGSNPLPRSTIPSLPPRVSTSTPVDCNVDLELLEVMDNDKNESERELITSKELKKYIDDTNFQNSFYRPHLVHMSQVESNNSVEVDANLLLCFIRPFFDKSGVNCSGDLLQVHSDLRGILGIRDCNGDKEKSAKKKEEIETETVEAAKSKFSVKLPSLKKRLHPKKNLKPKPVHITSAAVPVSCKYCGMKFSLPWHLRTHISEHHGLCKCGECATTFQFRARLQAHMSVHALENASEFHFCNKCKLAYASVESLEIHIQSHHQQRPSVSKLAIIKKGKKVITKAEVKTNTTNTKRKIALLKISSTGSNELQPPGSKKNGKTEGENTSREMGKAETERAISVKETGKGRVRPMVKKRIMTCPTCGDKFEGRDNLFEHMKCHQGMRRFTCSECGRGFLTSSTLHQHKAVHLGARFECKICGARLARQSSLTLHYQRHSGNFKHECNICGWKFVDKSNLNRHIATHFGPQQIKCSFCDIGFSSKIALSHHIREIHPEVNRENKGRRKSSIKEASSSTMSNEDSQVDTTTTEKLADKNGLSNCRENN